ncbi:MAG: permease [Candidatus Cloacimonetes bacterium]|nr:permease [Candidatus Cloacimonadota bacterium]
MNTLALTLKYFLTITIELTALFIGISTLVALMLMYIPQEKIQRWMSGRGIWGNVMGAVAGSITPFCACSTVPMAKGFLDAGVTFGAVMSFIIASPLLNPIILGMLIALVGVKACIAYFILVFGLSILFGVVLGRVGGATQVIQLSASSCCGAWEGEAPKTFPAKLKQSFIKAWGDYKAVLAFLLIGVGIGSLIYGYLPQDFVLKYAGGKSPLAIPIAAIIGIPMYIRTETAIPIGLALMAKGMSIGAVIALIIGGAGMAIPEMTMLASIFKKKTVAAIVAAVFFTAVISGFAFNALM